MDTAELRELFASCVARLDARPPEGALTAAAIAERLGAGTADGPVGIALGLVLLCHGHLEPAHELAQRIDGVAGRWLHAMMHRMEGDYGNAGYWHAQAGPHPAQAAAAERLRAEAPEAVARHPELVRDERLDPAALTRAVAALGGDLGGEEAALLRTAQRCEMAALFDEVAPA